MGWAFPADFVDISARISYGAAWNNVDLGANNDVPEGTTAVILLVLSGPATAYACNVRPTNASDNRTGKTFGQSRFFVGLDANRTFDGYFAHSSLVVYIVAYTDEEGVGRTTSVNKSTGTTGSYQTVDCSGDTPPEGAQVAFFEIVNTGTTAYNFALRKYNNGWELYKQIGGNPTVLFVAQQTLGFAGLDGSFRAEQKIEHGNLDLYLWGWGLGTVTGLDSPVDKTPPATTGWQDIDCSANVPEGAIGAIFQVYTGGNLQVGVRNKGSSAELRQIVATNKQAFMVCALNSSRICQGYKTNAALSYNLVGYFTPPAGTTYDLTTDVAAVTTAATPVMAVVRPLNTAIASQSVASAPVLAVERPLNTAIAGSSTTATPILAVERPLQTGVAAATTTSSPDLDIEEGGIVYDLETSCEAGSATSSPVLNVVRDLATAIEGITETSEPDLTRLIDLETAVAALTETAAPVLAVERDLATQVSGASSTAIPVLSVDRPLQTGVEAATQTSEPSLSFDLVTDIGAVSGAATPVLAVARELLTVIAALTATSIPGLTIPRALSTEAEAQTTTPAAPLRIDRSLLASVAVHGVVSIPLLNVLRPLASGVNAQVMTAEAVLRVIRDLATSIESSVEAGEVDLVIYPPLADYILENDPEVVDMNFGDDLLEIAITVDQEMNLTFHGDILDL